MYLSGSVGYTLLKQKNLNKHIFLLADIHDGVSYCSNDSVMIDRWLSLKDNNDILLEEAVRESFELTDLWPGAEHTQRLKKLNRNNKKIKPVDIRPLLIPFSWELLGDKENENKEQNNMIFEDYLSYIDTIFNYKKSKLMMLYFVPSLKKLNKEGNNQMKEILLQHFQEMKDLYMEFINDNKSKLKKTMKELYKSNQDLLEEINNITSMLMEWYILVLILNSKENCIIHLGLAHSNRILDFLTQVYSFEVIKKSGINIMDEINDEPKACLLVPDDINTKFK
jgi:hypothetical protein